MVEKNSAPIDEPRSEMSARFPECTDLPHGDQFFHFLVRWNSAGTQTTLLSQLDVILDLDQTLRAQKDEKVLHCSAR